MSQIFKTGDRIRVKENGFTGTVGGTSKTMSQDDVYFLVWDHISGCYAYMANQVGDLWEKIHEIAEEASAGYVNQDGDFLPHGMYGVQPGESIKKECDHKWVEVGFQHTKTVCYHCDMEKP